MKDITSYESAITEGSLFLVRNGVAGKNKRYDPNLLDGSMVYEVLFHAHAMGAPAYLRYCVDSRSLYKNAQIGEQYYLVLKPHKKYPAELSVIAWYPCADTNLTPGLTAALARSAGMTGQCISPEEEWEALQAASREREAIRRAQLEKQETPEQTKKRLKKEEDDGIFADMMENVPKKLIFFLQVPLFMIGLVLAFFEPVWGVLTMFGSGVLFLLALVFLIAMKKPLVAWKRNRQKHK